MFKIATAEQPAGFLRTAMRWLPIALLSLLIQSCGGNRTDQEYMQLARKALERGNYNVAVIELKNALQTNPENSEARLLLGKTYIDFEDGASAEKELRHAQEQGLSDNSLMVSLARALFLQGKYDEIVDEFPVAPELAPDQKAELLAIRGQSFLFKDNVERARAELDEALRINDKTVTAMLGHARVNVVTGDLGSVRPWLEEALSVEPKRAEAWSLLGRLEESSGDLEAAAAAYSKALDAALNQTPYLLQRALLRIQLEQFDQAEQDINKLPDTHPGKFYAQGLIQFQQQQYKNAQHLFEQALSKYSKYTSAVYYLGMSHYMQEHQGQADSYLKQFLELVPNSNAAANTLAQLQMRKGDLESAEKLLDSILAREAENSQALELKAGLLLARGKRAQAIELYRQLVALHPESGEARSRLGLALMAQGDVALGTAELEKAIELQPEEEKLQLSLFMGLLNSGANAKALAAAEQWVATMPQSVPALLSLGWARLANQQSDQAKATFLKVLELSPGNASAAHNLAVLAMLAGDADGALAFYQDSLKVYPDHVGTNTALAKLYRQLGQNDKAIALLEKLRQTHPESVPPAALLGELLLQSGDVRRAVQVLSETANTSPDATSILTVLGAAQAESGSYNSAARTLEHLLTLQPDVAVNHYLLAQVYYKKGDKDRFATALRKAYQLTPDALDIQIAMVGLLVGEKKFDEAGELVGQLATKYPDNAEVYVQSAHLAAALNKPTEEVKAFQQALNVAPKRSDLLVKYALAQWRAGQHDDAFRTMEDWLARNPADAVVKYNLATLYVVGNRQAEAIAAFTDIVKVNPEHVIALNNLAFLLKDTQSDKALEYAERAHKLSAIAPVQDTLAMILLARGGQAARAVKLLQNATEQAPGSAEISYHLALALVANNQREQARRVLTRLLSTEQAFAEQPEARALLERLGG